MSNHGISSSESDIVALLILVKKIPRSVSSPRRREGPTIVFSVALTQVLRLPHAQHVSSLLRANECALRRPPQFRRKKKYTPSWWASPLRLPRTTPHLLRLKPAH